MFPGHPGHVSRHHHGQHPVSHYYSLLMSHEGIIYKLREVLGQVQGAFYTFNSLDTEIKMFGNEPE